MHDDGQVAETNRFSLPIRNICNRVESSGDATEKIGNLTSLV